MQAMASLCFLTLALGAASAAAQDLAAGNAQGAVPRPAKCPGVDAEGGRRDGDAAAHQSRDRC